jgi:tetratricopeptide (TPR) repeat protein
MSHWWKLGIVVVFFPLAGLAQKEDEPLATVRTLLRNGQNDAAISRLEEIAVSQPALSGLQQQLGRAYYAKANYLVAIEHLKLALKQNQGDRDAAQLLGLSYYLTGQPAEAIPFLRQFQTAAEGRAPDAAYVLGLCYALTKQHDEAMRVISRLYDQPADSPPAHLIFARTLLLEGLDLVAEREAREALRQSPTLPEAHFVLGQAALYRADLPKAIAEFQAELELNPGYAPAFSRLGEAYFRVGRWDDAQNAAQRSIWLDSTSAESYVLLGKVLLHRKEFAPTLRVMQRAISIDPNNYTAHHLLSQAYRETGQSELAEREMKIAARLEQQRAASNHN